jgi:hypothetical protein
MPRLTPNERTALAKILLDRAETGHRLTEEQRNELRRHAGNLEDSVIVRD